MIEISYKNPESIVIQNSDKKEVLFTPAGRKIQLEDFEVKTPWEYEKSGNLLEVQKFQDLLFYKFSIDGKDIAIITSDAFDLTEEVLGFFGDIDVLIITGTKPAVKIFENIEAKMVIPYGEGKDVFLNALGQTPETVKKVKVGADLSGDTTQYVSLES